MTTRQTLNKIYQLLYNAFGPQHWWPGDTQFEIITGAILTQNTSWTNVEKAINNLKTAGCLSPEKMHFLELPKLAELIRPAGYFNVKANRLRNFSDWLFENYDGDLTALEELPARRLREELLSIKGIGCETADSILLYAFEQPVFVIDAYTARITARHHLIEPGADYEQLQYLFVSNLEQDVQKYNEYHALLVRVGKDFCKPKPRCESCPLCPLPHTINTEDF